MNIEFPDFTLTTAADADLPIECLIADGNEALESYVILSRMEEYIKRLKDELKEKAVDHAREAGIKAVFDSKISLRETKVFDYGDDKQLVLYSEALAKQKAETDAVSASIKARQKYLVDTGVATLTETKTTIAVSK
jgi:hypothetical protein